MAGEDDSASASLTAQGHAEVDSRVWEFSTLAVHLEADKIGLHFTLLELACSRSVWEWHVQSTVVWKESGSTPTLSQTSSRWIPV